MASKKAVLKSYVDKGNYKIVVFGDQEYVAFDAKLKEHEGKEVELYTWEKNGKHYCGFPKAGGFQKGGGRSFGKSPLEIYAQVLGTCMSYAKDKYVAELPIFNTEPDGDARIIKSYGIMSKAILADLAKIVPAVPVQTEAPNLANKAPEKPPQETSATSTGVQRSQKR